MVKTQKNSRSPTIIVTSTKFLIVIIEILLIFSPEFNFFGKYTWLLAAVGVCVFLFCYSNKQYYFHDKTTAREFVVFCLCFIWSLFSLVVNKSNDLNYLVFQIGTLLTILRNFLLVALIKTFNKNPRESHTDYYLEIFNLACAVYVAFTILFIIFPSFKEFWCNDVVSSNEVDYVAYQFRYSLNGFAAFASSTIFSIAVLSSAFLIARNIHQKHIIKYLFFYMTNFIGCFFYGRICLVSIAISILYLIITLWGNKRFYKLLICFIILLCVLLVILNFLADTNDSFKIWKNWAFSIINGLFSKDGVNDYSVTHMFNDMYFLPSFKTMLIGDGKYIDEIKGVYYMQTDVGFLRAILYYGIFGCILNYALFFVYIHGIWSIVKKDQKWRDFIICFLIVFVVLEMKGEAFQRCVMIIMPMYYTLKYDKQRIGLNAFDISIDRNKKYVQIIDSSSCI